MTTKQVQFLSAIAGIEKFSPAPQILARAMKYLRDPESDVASIASLVGSDPALTADIIRCANSAYYGTNQPSQSLDEAVQKIGFRETIHLLNLAVARIAAGRDLGSYGISAEDFWSECLFNGLFVRNLANATGRADPDEAYTVGLLRFIGRLAINGSIEAQGGGLFWLVEEPIAEWEIRNTGFVQAEAGSLLLAKWQFSSEMVQAVAGQDAPAELKTQNWLAEALHFAGVVLAQGLGVPFHTALEKTDARVPSENNFMLQSGLSAAEIATMLVTTREDYDCIRQTLTSAS